jgi:hypothetical protein
MVMVTELSRRHWRQAISQWLERADPVRSRWMTEHPRRDEILNDLCTDAIDLWLHASKVRAETPAVPSIWTAGPADELENQVLTQLLEAPELWVDLEEDYPRSTPTSG